MANEQYIPSYDGTKLFTEAYGDASKPPLVLCDGLGCDGFIWQHFLPAFIDDFYIIHFQYRGHGLSAPPAIKSAMQVSDLRTDLLTVMDYYNLPEATLLGHSMGVQVILDFGVHHPERVTALVPMCGSYGHPLDTFHNTDIAGKVLPYLKRAVSFSPRVAQELWSRILTTELAYQIAVNTEVNGKILRREEFGPYFDRLSAMDVEVFLGAVTGLGSHSVEMFLPDLKVPTLVVAGQHDTFTPAWLSERMHELLPNSELLMIPGGSHVAPIEQPELLHLRFRDFLSNAIAPKKRLRLRRNARVPRRSRRARKRRRRKLLQRKWPLRRQLQRKPLQRSRPRRCRKRRSLRRRRFRQLSKLTRQRWPQEATRKRHRYSRLFQQVSHYATWIVPNRD